MSLPARIELTLEDYEAVVALARAGTKEPVVLERMLRRVDDANGIVRNSLVVRWQELDSPLPPTTRFPSVWPPYQQLVVDKLRTIARVDIEDAVKGVGQRPYNIMVTRDLAGLVGWTTLDEFFSPT